MKKQKIALKDLPFNVGEIFVINPTTPPVNDTIKSHSHCHISAGRLNALSII